MEASSKNSTFIIVIAILLLSNFLLIYFLLSPKDHGKHEAREKVMKEFLKKDIGFTEQQMAQYDTLNKQSKDKIKVVFDALRDNKEQQLKLLAAANFSNSAIASTAAQSSDMQRNIEVQILQQFKAIRTLCNKEQEQKFDSLFYKVLNKDPHNRKK